MNWRKNGDRSSCRIKRIVIPSGSEESPAIRGRFHKPSEWHLWFL